MQGHLGDFTRISTRSSHKDLYKILQGPLRGFYRHPYKIFSQGIVKDLDQDLHASTPQRLPHGRHKRPCCCCWRESYKILKQEPPKRISEELSYKHLQYMASARSSCKDLLERILPGSPHKIFSQFTCQRSCKDLLEDLTRVSTRYSHKDLCKIMQGPLCKIMQGPLTKFHQDLHNICSQGPLQDLA